MRNQPQPAEEPLTVKTLKPKVPRMEKSESEKAIARLKGREHLNMMQIQAAKYGKFTEAYDKQEKINVQQRRLMTETMNELSQKNLEHLHAAFGGFDHGKCTDSSQEECDNVMIIRPPLIRKQQPSTLNCLSD